MAEEFQVMPALRLGVLIGLITSYVISLSLNTLLLAAFIRGYKDLKSAVYFIIACQIVICDVIILALQLWAYAYSLCFILNEEPSNQRFPETMSLLLNFISMAYQGTISFGFLMTVNRLLIFMFKRLNDMIFGRPQIFFVIIIFWIWPVGYLVSKFHAHCLLEFEDIKWILNCTHKTPFFQNVIINGIQPTIRYNVPIIMAVVYALIFVEIRFHIVDMIKNLGKSSYENTKFSKREVGILVQSVIICSIFIIEPQISLLEVKDPTSPWVVAQPIGENAIWVVKCTVHFIVFYCFNAKIRGLVQEIVYCGHPPTTVTVLNAPKSSSSNFHGSRLVRGPAHTVTSTLH